MSVQGLRRISIFDTTLRDGEQAPGYGLSVDQKIEIALASEALGTDTIEIGFPASSPVDFQAASQISCALTRATTCGFSRSSFSDIDACVNAMKEAVHPQIQLATAGSDIHIQHKRQMTHEQVLTECWDAIDYARAQGFVDISLAIEDASRSDRDFLRKMIEGGLRRQITAIAIPDTVGICLPQEFAELIQFLRKFVGESIRISVHCHDDLGLAVANSVAAISAGADEVQTTLCGIGERAGNTSLEELIAILTYKAQELQCTHSIHLDKIYDTCHLVARHTGCLIPKHKAIIGANAFASEAGMHQQGLLRNKLTYEFMCAEDFGARSYLLFGRHSGRRMLRQRLQDLGITAIEENALDRLYKRIMDDNVAHRCNENNFLRAVYQSVLTSSEYV